MKVEMETFIHEMAGTAGMWCDWCLREAIPPKHWNTSSVRVQFTGPSTAAVENLELCRQHYREWCGRLSAPIPIVRSS
jgi:ribosomal protein S14